ncbi:MAG: dihydrodipicolinate synthase family protein [Actinomycetota bacterium]
MRTPPTTMPALITPFDRGGSVDMGAHRHNLATLTERGIGGFLIGGSTGQGPYLETGERTVLIEIARSELGDDPFLLAGISAQSVRQANRQIDEAAAAGADAALVVTPTFLLRSDHDLVVSFFLAVADASTLPVFLYTVPAVTGYEISVDATAALAGHSGIVGMKDSGGDVDRVAPILKEAGDGFTLYVGASRAVHAAAEQGAQGAITASANYVPDLVADARGDHDAQERLTAITHDVERHGIAGTYAAAELFGLSPGSMRAPLRPLDDTQRATLRTVCCSDDRPRP